MTTDKERFMRFRNTVLEALNSEGIDYKVFGGAVVQIVNNSRVTDDLDIMPLKSIENIDKIIWALVKCGYNTEENIINQIYGEGNMGNLDEVYAGSEIRSNNPKWEGLHIDLVFNLGEQTYENTPTNKVNHLGIEIPIISFEHILRMKANIFPRPRDKDIEDIQILAEYLDLDPSTGRKKGETKDKKKRRGFFK